jgi:ATP-binding protein involved in chromosome partitioning
LKLQKQNFIQKTMSLLRLKGIALHRNNTYRSVLNRGFFWSKSKQPETVMEEKKISDSQQKQSSLAQQQQQQHRKHQITDKIMMPNIKHVIAVSSAKGGVGKSTVSSNIALALAHAHNKVVGLFDADVFGPSLHKMMGINIREKQVDPQTNMLIPASNYGVRVMSMGIIVPEDSAAIWRGPMVMGALNQLLTQTDWKELDYLVIDLPPGTGDVQLTLSQRLNISGAVIVSTPQDIALIDARRGINMFRKVEVPVLGIIENMSYHICSNCGHREHIFGHGGAEKCATEMNIPFLGQIPLHVNIREKSDIGAPIVVSLPKSEHSKKFCEIAGKIVQAVESQQATTTPEPLSIVIE